MMSSRLLKWCVLQPSARSTSSWVACFLTARSRSSAIPLIWGITTISINSSCNQSMRKQDKEFYLVGFEWHIWSNRIKTNIHTLKTTHQCTAAKQDANVTVCVHTDLVELSVGIENKGQDMKHFDPYYTASLVPLEPDSNRGDDQQEEHKEKSKPGHWGVRFHYHIITIKIFLCFLPEEFLH